MNEKKLSPMQKWYKKNKEKQNIWKTLTIWLIALNILIIAGMMIENNSTYKFNLTDNSTFEIRKIDFNLLTQDMEYKEVKNICDLNLKCIKVVSLEDETR